jgi:Ca2+-dependent lipid-binding protein
MPPLLVNGFNTSSAMIQPDEKPSFFDRSFPFFKRKEPIIDDRAILGDSNYLGKMNFSLSFDKETCTLHIHILEAVDLPAKDLLGSSDPYVRLTLLPDQNETKITQRHMRSLNPKFNQVVSFQGHSLKKLHDMTLCMQVMDFDRFSEDDPIGEVLLPLKNVKFEHKPVYWKHLQPPTVRKEYQGELLLSVCYIPESSRMTVVVIKAKDLPSRDGGSIPDTYVKLWLVQHGNKCDKRKTTVKHQSLTPSFNETFSFNIPKEKIADTQLVAAIMEYELISSNDEIGHCIMGKHARESGQKHWKEIQAKTGVPISMWHKLTPKW